MMRAVARIGLAGWVASFLVACLATAARADELRAGVARVDVTPPLEFGCPLGGYGERMSRPAEGVHDRIFAKALVLVQGDKKFALVTADMLGFPPTLKPELMERLADDWAPDQVMLLASHSHTSIEMNALNPNNSFGIPQIGVYNARTHKFVVDRLVSVIHEAAKEPVPVAVGTTTESIPGWNRNRRGGSATDNDLTVTRIDTAAGKPLAVLVNFTAHPTFMSGEDMLFSAGWPGHLQRTLESLIGGGVTAMYYNGAEGDQSPIGRPGAGESHWERAERYGRDLGIVAWHQWEATKTADDAPLAYRSTVIDLPETTWHPDFMETGGKEYGLSEDLFRQMLPALFPAKVDVVSLRVGDLLIVGIPGEMAATLGMQIKTAVGSHTGAKSPVIGGLADVWISYMLPADEYRKGGYESSVSFYGETLGPTIVEGAISGASALKK